MNWLFDLADWFWPDWILRAWAWGAMILGSIVFMVGAASVFGHFVHGRPVLDAKTGEPMSGRQLLLWFLPFGGGGLLFAILGLVVHRWKSG